MKRVYLILGVLVVMFLNGVIVTAGDRNRPEKHDATGDSKKSEDKANDGKGARSDAQRRPDNTQGRSVKTKGDIAGTPREQNRRRGGQSRGTTPSARTSGRSAVQGQRATSQRSGAMVNAGAGEPSRDVRTSNELNLSPVPLNLRGKDRQEVARGSYLVNTVGGCNGCHAVNEFLPDGNPYNGQPKMTDPVAYMAGGVSFTGANGQVVISTNLRPDGNTGRPAGLSFEEFLVGLRHGIDFRQPGVIQQVSPWPSFKNMTESDLRAVYEYLSALPSQSGN
jgi:hypothetical protein